MFAVSEFTKCYKNLFNFFFYKFTGPGASSPTKSMSSGSMSGIVQDPITGREIVTVNVNQINEDLIRQVGAVSNSVNPPATNSYLQGNF